MQREPCSGSISAIAVCIAFLIAHVGKRREPGHYLLQTCCLRISEQALLARMAKEVG